MKRKVLTMLFVGMSAASYGQLHFLIDNKNPCVGQSVTFSLPTISGCSTPRVLSEADWSIYPVPLRSEVQYIFSAQNGVTGYTGVTITYSSYQPTISVRAIYNCKNGRSGPISDLILMTPPLGTPTIAGLDGNIYPGDRTTAMVSTTNGATYSWSLSVVQTISGSIGQSAVSSPSSAQTLINWPADFVGTVDVVATATAANCPETKQTTKRINVLTPPSAIFYESSVAPPAHCIGTAMRYRLEIFGGFTITQAQVVVSGGATDIGVFSTKNGVPVEWSVRWLSEGDIKVRYSVTDGTRMWTDRMTSALPFDVMHFDPGEIHPIPLTSYCAPTNVVLSIDRQPTGSPFVLQYCNGNDCSPVSSNWIDNNPSASSAFSGLSMNTSFRIKLTDTRCGTFQSNPVNIVVKPTPSISVSDQFTFSGGTFDIPSSDIPFSTVTVNANSTGVTGASNVILLQDSTTGALATQTLVTNDQADGVVTYSITPSKDGCTGETKNATVTVYPQPVIEADRTSVYKGLTANLKTGSHDSYLWQTESGEILGTDRTFKASVPDRYIVTVTKNGVQATSGTVRIDGQLTGINENYIMTRQPLRKLTSVADLENLSEHDVMENILYFDGLGRALQKVDVRMSPSGHDVIQPVAYDRYGREVRKYLPYISSGDNGRIRPAAIDSEQPAFYQKDDPTIPFDVCPFAESVFEASPLNRILKQGAPGSAWQPNADPASEHVIRHEYSLNTLADSVMRFSYDYDTEFITSKPYATGMLYRVKTLDEDKNEMIEFTDKLNRTICKKVHAGNNIYAYTYYVYDDLGNLVVVIPPEGAKAILKY